MPPDPRFRERHKVVPDRLEYEPLTPILYDRMTRSVGEKSLIRELLVGLLSVRFNVRFSSLCFLACNLRISRLH